MSKKKKQAALQAELEAQRAAEAQRVVRKPSVSFMVMNNCGPVPVAKPADFIQLTPVVQPLPIVPYSSQLQPLAMFDEDADY